MLLLFLYKYIKIILLYKLVMPTIIYNGQNKSINLVKYNDYIDLLQKCKNKFNSKSINLLFTDGELVSADNCSKLNNDSIIYCYNNIKHKKSLNVSEIHNTNNTLCKKYVYSKLSFMSSATSKNLYNISINPSVKNLHVYPNCYSSSECSPIKGCVIVSKKYMSRIGIEFGKGSSVYGVNKIESKFKKLSSLKELPNNSYISIYKPCKNDYNNNFKYFDYIIVIKTTSKKYNIPDNFNKNNMENIQKLEIEYNKKLRDDIAQKIFTKLGIITYNKLIEQNESSVIIKNNEFHHLNDITQSNPALITGPRNYPAYIVEVLNNYTPSCVGRRFSPYETNKIARKNRGEIKGSIRNYSLISDDEKYIYDCYPKGFKNIYNTIQDLIDKNVIKILIKIDHVLTLKKK